MRRSVLSPFPANRSGVRPPFRTKLSWPISKDASRSVVLGGLHSVVCRQADCPARGWSHGVDPLRPATPRLRSPLALALLVARIRADHHDPPMPTDHPALVADRLDARVRLYGFLILFCLLVGYLLGLLLV